MDLKSHLTTGFLALAHALPAQAGEERTPYAASRECAIQSLRENFAPFTIDVIEEELFIGASTSIGDAEVSSYIAIDPESGFVNWIDAQFSAADPDVDLGSSALLDYKNGTQNAELSANGQGQVVVESAVALTRNVDNSLRKCSQGMLLGALGVPAPHIG